MLYAFWLFPMITFVESNPCNTVRGLQGNDGAGGGGRAPGPKQAGGGGGGPQINGFIGEGFIVRLGAILELSLSLLSLLLSELLDENELRLLARGVFMPTKTAVRLMRSRKLRIVSMSTLPEVLTK
jgi:hypothetical protein